MLAIQKPIFEFVLAFSQKTPKRLRYFVREKQSWFEASSYQFFAFVEQANSL